GSGRAQLDGHGERTAAGVDAEAAAQRRVGDCEGARQGRGRRQVQVGLDGDVVDTDRVEVEGQGLADRHGVAGVDRGAHRRAQGDRVEADVAGAGEAGAAGDPIVHELVVVDREAGGGEGDVAEAGVAGERYVVGAAV